MGAVLINGVSYAWANITANVLGVPLTGITAINYKRKQTKTNNMGAGPKPVSRGYGNYEFEGDIEIYMETLKAIIAGQANRDILAIPPFDITVVFTGQGVITTTDILKACEFLEDPMDAKQGDTRLLARIPLIIADIFR